MSGKKGLRALQVAAVAVVGVMGGFANASAILSSNLIVERIGGDASYGGSGTAAGSAATAVFLDEFTKSTLQPLPVQTIPMPTTPSGTNLAATDSGSATSNGYLTRSADGSVLIVPGHNAAVGTAGVANTSPATVNRVIGLVDSAGTVDTSHAFADGPSGNFRSVTSDNGLQYWVSANATSPRYHPGTGTTTTQVVNANTRNLTIFGGHLFFTSMSGAFIGVNDTGGLPTGASTSTLIADTASGTGTPSPYGMQFFDLDSNNYGGTGADTLYIADDRSSAAGGGLQKWHFDGTSWSLQYIMNTGLPASNGLRGLTGEVVAGTPVLYATSGQSLAGTTNNSLWSVTDTGAGSTFSRLADSPNNTFFRGVTLAPTGLLPEPASLGVVGVSTLLLACRRRRA